MYVLQQRLLGRAEGDFQPQNQTREDFLQRIEAARQKFGLPRGIGAPRVAFTNRVQWDVRGTTRDQWAPGFHRTKEDADGEVLVGTECAVAIFNGDCPCVTIFSLEEGVLGHIHAGYRCLIRENPAEPNIIEVAAGLFPLRQFSDRPNLDRLRAFIWGGIGPCCWVPEYEDKKEILQPALARPHHERLAHCIGRTTRSPLGYGHPSVDLYQLARLFLRKVGIPEENITWDTTCTCCAMGDQGEPRYWSHTRWKAERAAGRTDGVDGRNMAVAWLEEVG